MYTKATNMMRIRFTIERLSDYRMLNPNNTAHTFVSKLLRAFPVLRSSFKVIDGHSMSGQSDSSLPYTVQGMQLIDVLFSTNVISVLDGTDWQQFNNSLKTTRLLAYREVSTGLLSTDLNIVRFSTNLGKELFDQAALNYEGQIKLLNPMTRTATEMSKDRTLVAPMTLRKDLTTGYFSLPVKYNSLVFLHSLFWQKRVPLAKLSDEVVFEVQLVVREGSQVCSCAKPAIESLSTGGAFSLCVNCLTYNLLHR